VFHKDSAQDLRSNPEKLRAILPVDVVLIHESEKRLMNQDCGLKGVPRGFTPHVVSRPPPKILIHNRHQSIERGTIPLAPFNEESCEVVVSGFIGNQD
jgi:hypothetical protein